MEGEFAIEGLEGFDLRGKTLGVVGAGRIGLHVIRIARAFSMRVLVFDVRHDGFMAETLGFEYATMDRLLRESDIITLHAPYNKATHHMIDEKALRKMKRGVMIINTARGGLIDTKALVEALDSGKVAGLGLDVIEGEEMLKEDEEILYDDRKMKKLVDLVKNDLLIRRYNVVYTPHIAFYSREAFARNVATVCENIRAFASGKPQNVVSQ
jgi:D-lactate dehydrogenase